MSIDLLKENGFTFKKARNKRYPAETMTNAHYTDDLVLLANTPTEAESLLRSIKQAEGGIGLSVTANKTEYIFFKQKGAISTLRGKPLKLVVLFKYFGGNISSTESDVNIRLAKAGNATDRLSII